MQKRKSANMKAFWGRDRSDRHIARGSEREAAEFERLYRESYTLVYNYVSYRMAGADAVEDVVAEAFCKAARSFGKFDPSRAKFSTWVITIARNCLSDYWRKQRPSTTLDDVSEDLVAVNDEYAVLNDDRECVRKLLACIDESDRELVFKKYYEGKRNVDIARETGMNESTVATRLQRALRKMRAAYPDISS